MAPYLTDHAMLRWLERVVGIDVATQRRICETAVADLVASGASGGWIMGAWCVVKNGRVISFLPSKPDFGERIRNGNLADTGPWR